MEFQQASTVWPDRVRPLVGDRNGDDDRESFFAGVEEVLHGVEAGLEVEGVKDGLGEEQIDAAFDEGLDLLVVGLMQLVVGSSPVLGAVDIRREGCGAVGWADRSGDKDGTVFFFSISSATLRARRADARLMSRTRCSRA